MAGGNRATKVCKGKSRAELNRPDAVAQPFLWQAEVGQCPANPAQDGCILRIECQGTVNVPADLRIEGINAKSYF